MSPARYFHTLRYLRPVQFYGRLKFRLQRPAADLRPAPALRARQKPFEISYRRPATMTGPDSFGFLNVSREHVSAETWNDPVIDKLWLYNLHYFDDLVAEAAETRRDWHRALMQRWIDENPPVLGNGWEPYPTSLRIVNWVKWGLAGETLTPAAVQSIAIQARHLSTRLEYHLLGNHLWANGKALLFAGAYFDGAEADSWRRTGLGILAEQLKEQVLEDGGHFERSPMYHSIFIEDLIDLVTLAGCHSGVVDAATVDRWKTAIESMLNWLAAMTHPDGGIACFNDATSGIASSPGAIHDAANMMGLAAPAAPAVRTDAAAPLLTSLQPSGYVRLSAGDFMVIGDVGPIGPDYIPGHAHADTLAFELSLRGQRVFGNSGTSCYGTGPQRQLERGTAAHNALTVDSQDSSEVWHGFRVARRARPLGLRVTKSESAVEVQCAHDGYRRLRGRPMHTRRWTLGSSGLQLHDLVEGEGEHEINGFLHVQPGIAASQTGPNAFTLQLDGRGTLSVRIEGAAVVELHEGTFAAGFGQLVRRPVIAWRAAGRLPLRTLILIEHKG